VNNKEFIQQQWVKDEIIKRLNYNPTTGDLTWAVRDGQDYFNKSFAGKTVGQKWVDKDGYKNYTVNIEMKGRKLSIVASRLCWLLHTGDWPNETIDHINRDPFDNRFCNLRDVSQKVNNFNKGFYKGHVFKYISKREDYWVFRYQGRHLGNFKCLGKAIKARDEYFKQ
jgi:hypothetical protein